MSRLSATGAVPVSVGEDGLETGGAGASVLWRRGMEKGEASPAGPWSSWGSSWGLGKQLRLAKRLAWATIVFPRRLHRSSGQELTSADGMSRYRREMGKTDSGMGVLFDNGQMTGKVFFFFSFLCEEMRCVGRLGSDTPEELQEHGVESVHRT
ncbi:hypothetical protein CSUB01_00582 [Colletotrichum sublineola]|uniref:Uncharacterized protein n=1 Tax=Colletotrichum sublineola TaxID=1173701 RepID=A0A066X1D4_COLSU|nr:hypothetical protein CSUB01_00582 [Colletotrichum sublineola]